MVCERGERVARPKRKNKQGMEIYSAENICTLIDKYLENIESRDDVPNIKEFCLVNGLSYDWLMQIKQIPRDRPETRAERKERERITQYIKKIKDWREVKLEQGGLQGKFNPTVSVFALKQEGWTDRIQTQNDTNIHISLTEWEDGDTV